MNIKVYVDVTAKFNSDGFLIPINLTWEDGQVFEIDRVTDIRQAAAMKAGGQGDPTQYGSEESKAICSLNGAALSLATISAGGS